MAFKLQRAKRLVEDIELCDERGNAVKAIQVDLDIETMAIQINKAKNEIVRIEQMLKNDTDPKSVDFSQAVVLWEEYGKAFIVMLRLVFGDENAQIVLDHYDNRLGELVTEITPFLQQVVLPAVEQGQRERAKRLAQNYKPKGGLFGR